MTTVEAYIKTHRTETLRRIFLWPRGPGKRPRCRNRVLNFRSPPGGAIQLPLKLVALFRGLRVPEYLAGTHLKPLALGRVRRRRRRLRYWVGKRQGRLRNRKHNHHCLPRGVVPATPDPPGSFPGVAVIIFLAPLGRNKTTGGGYFSGPIGPGK